MPPLVMTGKVFISQRCSQFLVLDNVIESREISVHEGDQGFGNAVLQLLVFLIPPVPGLVTPLREKAVVSGEVENLGRVRL